MAVEGTKAESERIWGNIGNIKWLIVKIRAKKHQGGWLRIQNANKIIKGCAVKGYEDQRFAKALQY